MSVPDALLRARVEGTLTRVALVGAGTTAKMIALQLLTPPDGICLAAIGNRTLERAEEAFVAGGAAVVKRAFNVEDLEDSIERGQKVVVRDASLLCQASNIDVIVEVTGTVEFALRVVLEAIQYRKHVVLVNAELDSTLGPMLKTFADRAGVVITNTDGDEPGVAMTLIRYLRSIGLRPVAAGNIKGMLDPYRTPETQAAFAKEFNQNAAKVTSFADGTKLSMEATVLANATGFGIGRRGMFGPACTHVNEMSVLLPAGRMLEGGLVDYALGAAPHTGAFVIVYEENILKRRELSYYKMGNGPFYVFYTPYHLPHIQIASTILRASAFGDATVAPQGPPVSHVLTMAKRDLREGERLDGVGGFAAYGVIDDAKRVLEEGLLPMGLSEGCVLRREIRRDETIRFADVELPAGRLCDSMWRKQCDRFGSGRG